MTVPSRLALMTASCGVTPQPQNTGTFSSSPATSPNGRPSMVNGASPHCGTLTSLMPSLSSASLQKLWDDGGRSHSIASA
ncbi:hypothetical protein VD0002_g8749 [Verticillium dahliae]|uniref:Uncharacterized protein n=1 Tax=Verticillium dahliae TaxID=27337 RepID=A0AA44WNT3_VERDA|nr:hypothetical protein BJF96_g2526 [Verticillium dahliae]PNH58780.1 hypothetical protein VD0002_g8749 [Verticillium dahliae]